MERKLDTWQYYDPERALDEEINWILDRTQHQQWDWLRTRIEGVTSIIEFGCGSGLLAAKLPETINYAGFDRNDWFIKQAARRESVFRKFYLQDVRDVHALQAELGIAFNFLKNFSPEDWPPILSRLMSHARQTTFDVQIAETGFDDGTEYHHSFASMNDVQRVIDAAGHELIETGVFKEFAVRDRPARLIAFWTRKITG